MANDIGNIGGSAATGAGLGSMLMPGAGTLVGAGAGGLLGILKSIMDADNERKDRIMQSTTTRYSPWTKLQAASVGHSNGLGDIAAGVAGGAQTVQGLQKSASDTDLGNAIAAKLRAPAQISTPTESGKQAAPVIPAQPSAAAPSSPDPMAQFSTGQDTGNGADLDQIMKLLRMAQSGRQSLGRYNA